MLERSLPLLLWWVLAAIACSPIQFRIGKYGYRKHILLTKVDIEGSLLSLQDYHIVGSTSADLVRFIFAGLVPNKIHDVDTFSGRLLYQMNRSHIYALKKQDGDIYNLTLQFDGNNKVTAYKALKINTTYKQTWGKDCTSFVSNPNFSRCLFTKNAESFVFNAEPEITVRHNKTVQTSAYLNSKFYIFTGEKLEAMEDDISGNTETLFTIQTGPVTGRSIVEDYESNTYVCHSHGISMLNKALPHNVETFTNISRCRCMIFYDRDVFLDDGETFSKYRRLPYFPGPSEASLETDSTATPTTSSAPPVTPATAATGATAASGATGEHYTGLQVQDDELFFMSRDSVGNFSVPLIIISYFVFFALLFFFIMFVFTSVLRHRITNPFNLDVRT